MKKRPSILIGLLSLILIFLVSLRRPISIAYHKASMNHALQQTFELGGNDRRQSKYVDLYYKHREALVRLGYFERKEFLFQNIEYPSLQSRRLWEELNAKFPDYKHVEMHGYEPNTPDKIIVWDKPKNISKWEKIIKAHDIPQQKDLIDSYKSMLTQRILSMWENPGIKDEKIKQMRAVNPEWDFMFRTYSVLGVANLSLGKYIDQDRACKIIDTIISETLELEKKNNFEYFLMNYYKNGRWVIYPPRSQFVDSQIALMLAVRRLIKENYSYKPLLSQRINIMIKRMNQSPLLCAESYPDECWIFCNSISLAAIRLSDILDGTDHTDLFDNWIRTAKAKLIDHRTGILISAFNFNGEPLSYGSGPEGTSIWMACHMLQIVNPEFAKDQYNKSKKYLGKNILGFGYSREWPESTKAHVDIDSGPTVPFIDASASASGLAIIAASSFKDKFFFESLERSIGLLSMPIIIQNNFDYTFGNALGDAVLLYGLVSGPLWDQVRTENPESDIKT